MIQRFITAVLIFCFTQTLATAALSEETIAELLTSRSPHPTQLTVEYRGQPFPVLRMKRWKPIIAIEGREKKLANERDYMPRRASSYGPEQVEVIEENYSALQTVKHEVHGIQDALMGAHHGSGEFKGIFQSRRTMKDPFISIIIYTPLMFMSAEHQDILAIHVFTKELPDLPAGKKVKVRFTTLMPVVFPGQKYFFHIFDRQGREAKTNAMQKGWPYYALTERKLMGDAIPRYLGKFSGQDHAVTPIVMMNPLLPEGTALPEKQVSATFTVTTMGHVKDIKLTNADSDALGTAVQEAVKGWLFLPRLIRGEPVESLVEVPIQF